MRVCVCVGVWGWRLIGQTQLLVLAAIFGLLDSTADLIEKIVA